MPKTSLPGAQSDQIRELTMAVVEAKNKLVEAIRQSPPEPVENWDLRDLDGSPLKLGDLFAEHDDLLVVHNMGSFCNYCSLWADGFGGLTGHFAGRCAFVLCSNDEPQDVKAFAAKREWSFRCVSGAGSGFAKAMGYMEEDGSVWPGVSGFHKNADGSIVRTGSAPFGPGDDFCAVWPMFDLLDGGVKGWEPRKTETECQCDCK